MRKNRARQLFSFVTIGTLVVGLCWLRRRVDRPTIQRRFWNPVYDHLAGLYDAVDWLTFNTTQRFRQRVLPYLPAPGGRLLEVGFGTGRLHVELASLYEMAGVDLAPGMVRITRNRLASKGLQSDLRQGSVYSLPWPSDSFDAVLSTFAFSAFADAESALDEMIRVTRPGGRLIILDAGEARNGNLLAHGLAILWQWLGDYMRDEVPLMQARGLSVLREEFGPGGCIHLVVGICPGVSV